MYDSNIWLQTIQRIQDRFLPNGLLKSDSYPFFPCSLPAFVEDLQICKELGASGKFLDIGCGIGVTMAIAECLGFESWGIEIDEKNGIIRWNKSME